MKVHKVAKSYRLSPELVAMLPEMRQYLTDKLGVTIDETTTLEYALRALAKEAKIKTPKLGPSKCSECGELALEGSFYCPVHTNQERRAV